MATKKKTADKPGPVAAAANKLDPPIVPPRADFSLSTEIAVHKLETVTHALEGKIPNILKLEAAAERIKITDEESFNRGSTFVAACDRELDQIEALRKATYGPVWDYAKLISATFKTYSDRLTIVRKKANDLLKSWYDAEELRKRTEAEALRKKQEEEARAQAAKHEKAGDPELAQQVLDSALNAPPPSTAVLTGGGRTNALGGKTIAKKVWRGRVVDREALLRGILEGKVPWVVIEFKESELNTVARQVQAESVFHGIKVTHETELSQRKGAW